MLEKRFSNGAVDGLGTICLATLFDDGLVADPVSFAGTSLLVMSRYLIPYTPSSPYTCRSQLKAMYIYASVTPDQTYIKYWMLHI